MKLHKKYQKNKKRTVLILGKLSLYVMKSKKKKLVFISWPTDLHNSRTNYTDESFFEMVSSKVLMTCSG